MEGLAYEKKQALPPELEFSRALPKELGGSDGKWAVCVPKNGTVFAPASFTLIDLVRSSNSVWDPKNSYLRFSVKMGDTADTDAGTIAGSAACFISSIETFHNSVAIDNIRAYDLMHNIMLDCTMSHSYRGGTGNICWGCLATGGLPGIALARNTEYFFSLPLLSIFGSNTDTALPTHDMHGYLSWRITWNNNIKAIAAGGAADPNFVIQNVEMHCCMTELSETPLRLVSSPSYRIPTQGISNWSTTFNSGTVLNLTIPFRYRDLRQILLCFRVGTVETTRGYYSNSRSTKDIESYQFLIGGRAYPPTRVRCKTTGHIDPYMQLQNSFHISPGSALNLGIINNTNYKLDNNTAGTGTFCIGLNCESYNGHSGALECGMDTTNTDIIFSCTFGTAVAAATIVDAFAIYGAEILVEDGQSILVY